jgi:mRNA interferase HigB
MRTMRVFGDDHPETRASLRAWSTTIKQAAFQNMSDVQGSFSKAKVLNNTRVRFQIAGGDYRLIASFNFRRQAVFVKFIGSHAEYDAVDALTVAQF